MLRSSWKFIRGLFQLKSLPTILILHQFLYQMHLSRVQSKTQKHILCFEIALQSCWGILNLHTLGLHYKKCLWVRLFEVVLPTWKLVQIRGKFSLQVERMLHEQINTGPRKTQRYHPTKQDADSSDVPTELYNLACQLYNRRCGDCCNRQLLEGLPWNLEDQDEL